MGTIKRQVNERLREARLKLERGWTREQYAKFDDDDELGYSGDWEKRAVGFCMIGALYAAQSVSPMQGHLDGVGYCARNALDRCIKKATGRDMGTLNFNDAAGRTQAEVLEVFDCAIAATEEDGNVEEQSE